MQLQQVVGARRMPARSRPRWVRAAAAVVVLALIGCAQRAPTEGSRVPVNLSGYSAAFKDGFTAGCDTARGKARRDDGRFKADEQYARGWDDGRSICSRR